MLAVGGVNYERLDTNIRGCFVIRTRSFSDDRGIFEQQWDAPNFAKMGLEFNVAQANASWSMPNVIRGLHIQNKNPQGKLVRCLFGKVLDVCVDARPDSPTFGQKFSIVLTPTEGSALYCPPGTLHGFSVFNLPSLVHYLCTTPYEPEHDAGVRYDDPQLAIDWRVHKPVLSKKDQALPSFQDFVKLKGEVNPWHQ